MGEEGRELMMDKNEYHAEIEGSVEGLIIETEIDPRDFYTVLWEKMATNISFFSPGYGYALQILLHSDNDNILPAEDIQRAESVRDVVNQAAVRAYFQDMEDELGKWTEERVCEAKQLFLCTDCDDYGPLQFAQTDADGDGPRCFQCHAEHVETLIEEDAMNAS